MSLRIPINSLLAAMLVLPMLLGVLSSTAAAAPDTNGAAVDGPTSHFGFGSVLGQSSATQYTRPGRDCSATFSDANANGTVTLQYVASTNVFGTINVPTALPGDLYTLGVFTDAGGSQPETFTNLGPVSSSLTLAISQKTVGNAAGFPAGTGIPTIFLLNQRTLVRSVAQAVCAPVTGTACTIGTAAFALLSSVNGSSVTAQFLTNPPGNLPGPIGGPGFASPFVTGNTNNQFLINVIGSVSSPTLFVDTNNNGGQTENPSLSQVNSLGSGFQFPFQFFPGIGSGFNRLQQGTLYSGSTSGIPVQGGFVSLFSSNSEVARGTINCQPIPLPPPPPPPPPPLQYIPPPPPPLLPPPPPAPMQGIGRPMAEVPVIPEADSLFLLAGGLAILGGLVAARTLRRRDDA